MTVFGLAALDGVGTRFALVFVASALIAVPVAAQPSAARGAVVLAAAVLTAGTVLAVVLHRHGSGPWLGTAILLVAGSAWLLGSRPQVLGSATVDVAAWVLVAAAGGIAAARGPVWGLLAFLVIGGVNTWTAVQYLHVLPVMSLLGALTFFFAAGLSHVLALRGYAVTETAVAAAEEARTQRTVAEARLQARRSTDRLLHDTVLATLTLLAHGGKGVPVEQLRAVCDRDATALVRWPQDPLADPTVSDASQESRRAGSSAQASGEASRLGGVTVVLPEVARSAQESAAQLGLVLETHVSEVGAALANRGVDAAAAQALEDAVAACLDNVARHSGQVAADLAVAVQADSLVVMVTDDGGGFDPGAVAADRLGLRASVRERLVDVGGNATVYSRRGQGTTVVLTIPLVPAS